MKNIISEFAQISNQRAIEIKKSKKKGKKVIEYTGSFIPEQLIYAAEAEPYILNRGGEPGPSEAVLEYMLRFMNPFAKSQIGYYLMGMDPITPLADIIICQQTDAQVGRISELMEYLKLPIFKIGVPPDWEKDYAFDYYFKSICKLKIKLEQITGNKITEVKLRKYILLINKVNDILYKISELRKFDSPLIGGYNFILINHCSFFCSPEKTIKFLTGLFNEAKDYKNKSFKKSSRVLLVGHVLAVGDYVVPKLIESSGGLIVAEIFDEGIRHFNIHVKTEGNLLKNICHTYFREKHPPSIFQPSWRYRFKYMKKMINDNRIDGVIWYQLSFDEIYDMEYACVNKWIQELKIPLLKLESNYEYSREAMNPLRTRIESFIELINKRRRIRP